MARSCAYRFVWFFLAILQSTVDLWWLQVPPAFIAELGRVVERELGVLPEQACDFLIIKAPQSGTKGEISLELGAALKAWGGAGTKTSLDVILYVGPHQRAPDVAFWSVAPTRQQFNNPLANHCPPPNLWLELFYNDRDRDEALTKIQNDVIPTCGATCCIVAIGLQRQATNAMINRLGAAAAPGVAAVAAAPLLGRPHLAPYVGVWAPNTQYENAQWYVLQHGRYVDLVIPQAGAAFRLDFDLIARCL